MNCTTLGEAMAAKWTDVFVREADGASVYEPSSLFACLDA